MKSFGGDKKSGFIGRLQVKRWPLANKEYGKNEGEKDGNASSCHDIAQGHGQVVALLKAMRIRGHP